MRRALFVGFFVVACSSQRARHGSRLSEYDKTKHGPCAQLYPTKVVVGETVDWEESTMPEVFEPDQRWTFVARLEEPKPVALGTVRCRNGVVTVHDQVCATEVTCGEGPWTFSFEVALAAPQTPGRWRFPSLTVGEPLCIPAQRRSPRGPQVALCDGDRWFEVRGAHETLALYAFADDRCGELYSTTRARVLGGAEQGGRAVSELVQRDRVWRLHPVDAGGATTAAPSITCASTAAQLDGTQCRIEIACTLAPGLGMSFSMELPPPPIAEDAAEQGAREGERCFGTPAQVCWIGSRLSAILTPSEEHGTQRYEVTR